MSANESPTLGRSVRPVILLVDTTIAGVAMGFCDDAKLLWHGAHHEHAGSVPAVSTLLSTGLRAIGASPVAIDGIAVAVGPGSFTGIKIGLAFVYGLHRALTELSDKATAWRAYAAGEAAARCLEHESGSGGQHGVFLPATRTHGFFSTNSASRLVDVTDMSSVEACLGQLPAGGRLVVSGAWPLAMDALTKLGRAVTELAPSEVSRAAIYGMSKESATCWPGGFGIELPTPRYLRLSTAEERLRGGVS